MIGVNRIALPKGEGPVAPIIKAIKKSTRSALARATRKPLGVGVAVGAMVDTDQGSIVTMNLAPSLDGYPLAEELRRGFGLPVRLDHHPRALLVGDRWFGKGRGAAQFAVIYTGEVLGDPHLKTREMIVDVDYPTRGTYQTVGCPIKNGALGPSGQPHIGAGVIKKPGVGLKGSNCPHSGPSDCQVIALSDYWYNSRPRHYKNSRRSTSQLPFAAPH